MNDLEYTYAVARVRTLEASLLNDAVIDQLLACKDEHQCLQLLEEKGWGSHETAGDMSVLLEKEEEKTWKFIREAAPDVSLFNVLSYSKLYHNLKAAVKVVCTQANAEKVFYEDCEIPGKEMLAIVENKEFSRLPGNMGNAAAEALEALLQTGDGQLCDIIIDRAALEAIYEAGKSASEEIIQIYAESMVAIADIKIGVRCARTGKTADFMKRAMAECGTVNVSHLIQAALGGMDAIREYLSGTAYAEGGAALEESPSAFERWCDNRMIETIKPQKYNAFSAGPLVAYLIARENEIKTVRIILTGKQNGFSDEAIRERVRAMYV